MPALRIKHQVNFCSLIEELEGVMLFAEISVRSGVSKSALSNIKARNGSAVYCNGAALVELYRQTFHADPPLFPGCSPM